MSLPHSLHPSASVLNTYPHHPSVRPSLLSQEWSFGDPSHRDCGRVSFSPSLFRSFFLCGRHISYSPPSSSVSSSPGLCSELDLIVARGLLCIFVADEGEKEGREEGQRRIYSGEEVMRRSRKSIWAFQKLFGGVPLQSALQPSILPFYNSEWHNAVSLLPHSGSAAVSFFVVLISSYEIFISTPPPTPPTTPPPICQT